MHYIQLRSLHPSAKLEGVYCKCLFVYDLLTYSYITQPHAPSGDQLKDRCLVLEVAFHGRALNVEEKAIIQSKVAKIVDALLKGSEVKPAAQPKVMFCFRICQKF